MDHRVGRELNRTVRGEALSTSCLRGLAAFRIQGSCLASTAGSGIM